MQSVPKDGSVWLQLNDLGSVPFSVVKVGTAQKIGQTPIELYNLNDFDVLTQLVASRKFNYKVQVMSRESYKFEDGSI